MFMHFLIGAVSLAGGFAVGAFATFLATWLGQILKH